MLRIIPCLLLFANAASAQPSNKISVNGLRTPVEVFRDTYGVNHIYAQNEHDLFFAQGYCASKDRLFQFEMWRRQATGTTAEILGPKEIKRDIGTRLFKFRGNLKQELNHYHLRGEQIITAFTEGINAFIKETERDSTLLPLEFRLLGIKPGRWTPDLVISRHQGLLGNLSEELIISRAVVTLGAEKLKELMNFEPGEPDLTIDPAISTQRLFDNITEIYDAFRRPMVFTPQDLRLSANTNFEQYRNLAARDEEDWNEQLSRERNAIGSNNWIVSGKLSQSDHPLLANDPHRAITAPSLRYMVHLIAPGWNVVGGGEPTIPGISIGHNEFGAWGLTVFDIDAEDLYVYQLNPQNERQYLYQGRWEDMRLINDTIRVKGAANVFADHLYTRHGPVTFIDKKNSIAYAVRCGWMELGGAPYLASLRMNQATNWNEFREACSFSHIPSENMIWADKAGNIGWQTVGIAPVRKNWSGLVPVPGDGRYEWSGYLPIQSLPSVFNPEKGYWATANENNVPEGYPHRNAVGWTWAEPYRVNRVNEVLGSGKKHNLKDMMDLQFDYLSIPARSLISLIKDLKSDDARTEHARQLLHSWNFTLDKNSIAAGIYVAWEKKINEGMIKLLVPEQARSQIRFLPLSKVIDWIATPGPELGSPEKRNQFLMEALKEAVADLTAKLGPDMKKWRYGQAAYHHVLIKHALSNAVDEPTRKKLEMGPRPRGGYGHTPGMTSNNDNQTSGASFRMAVDTKDWDTTMFTNTPGQSGNPDSPFYRNLFDFWANDKHFPVHFSRTVVEKSAVERVLLNP